MNRQYEELMLKILFHGNLKPSAREGMPATKSIFGTRLEYDLRREFPLITSKKVPARLVFTELLWFLKGYTNIKFLVDRKCNVWNKDAYKWYLRKHKELTGFDGSYSLESFVAEIKKGNLKATSICEFDEDYELGDLGEVYGAQWRNQNGVDQLANLLHGLLNQPFSRYHIVDAWNSEALSRMALPPCHMMFQCDVQQEDNYKVLNLQMYQRSCDMVLGVPFDLASYSFLLLLLADYIGAKPGVFTWIGGDTHIYDNHFDAAKEIIGREYRALPTVKFNGDFHSLEALDTISFEDFEIIGYDSHPTVKAELNVGI